MKTKVTESRHFNYSAFGFEGRVRLKLINNTQAGDGRVVAHGDFSMAQFFNCRYIINPLIAPYVKLLTVCFLKKKISHIQNLVIKGECLNLRTLLNHETKHNSVRRCNFFSTKKNMFQVTFKFSFLLLKIYKDMNIFIYYSSSDNNILNIRFYLKVRHSTLLS